jgi:hypothetical protein
LTLSGITVTLERVFHSRTGILSSGRYPPLIYVHSYVFLHSIVFKAIAQSDIPAGPLTSNPFEVENLAVDQKMVGVFKIVKAVAITILEFNDPDIPFKKSIGICFIFG